MSLACCFCKNRHMVSAMNDTALRHSNWRAARPEVFDRGREAQSSLAAQPGKDYCERAQGTGKLADMDVPKVWARYPKNRPAGRGTAAIALDGSGCGLPRPTSKVVACAGSTGHCVTKMCHSPKSGQVRQDTCPQPAIQQSGRCLSQLRFNLH